METLEFREQDLERCECGHRRMGHIQGFGACLHFLSTMHGAKCDCKRFEPLTSSESSSESIPETGDVK